MSRVSVLPDIRAESYLRNNLHGDQCAWVEKNCYVDLFIELVHALGLEPRAMLPFTLAVDFEGDQWTFFKPQHSEMRELYGINVQEMNHWRPLIEHAQEHLTAGRLIAVEADAFWMPDTAGTDYRQNHVKTTIMLSDLDLSNQRLGYFHNAGYYELEDDDFRQIFKLNSTPDPTYLPLFAELVHIDRVIHRTQDELANLSKGLVKKHLAYRPVNNPIQRFSERFAKELPQLHEKGLAHYHAWAFSTIRQLGSAFELAAANLLWLEQTGTVTSTEDLARAVESFQLISNSCKTLILKVARSVNSRRLMDTDATFGEMIQAWSTGMNCLERALNHQ